MTLTLHDVAALLAVPLPPGARADAPVRAVAGLADAREDQLSFLSSEQYVKQLRETRAGAVLVHKKVRVPDGAAPAGTVLLVVDDAELATAKVLAALAPPIPRPAVGVDPAARVAATAQLGADSRVGPFVVVGERTVLGARCVLHPGVYVGDDTVLGDDCELFPNVVVRERVTLGRRVVVHAGSVIGSDGFGYRWDGTKHAKVPQIGTVVIEDDVEIGSCACVDRAKFAETRVGRGTKIDNLVQVAHNVRTGPHCVIVGQAGLAGSVTLGAGVVLGGQSAVRDHTSMGDGAMLAACSGVMEDVPPKQVVTGLPAVPHRQALRENAALRRLPDLIVQVRKLQEQVERLTAMASGGAAPEAANDE
ncbi:MAG TPA: UDP-3-O-(3-hydroxymyristoyl)glucosamine N-acyltransferase [Humisphaera sp.]